MFEGLKSFGTPGTNF